MPDWLRSLPHQIPFRAVSAATQRSDREIEGLFLWTADDVLPPEVTLVEAMAQCAGSLVFQAAGLLTGIDRCEISGPIAAGDRIEIRVTLDASFGGTHRFSAEARRDGVEIGRGRFYLAAGTLTEP